MTMVRAFFWRGSIAALVVALLDVRITNAAPLNTGTAAQAPNPVNLLSQLEERLAEQPEIGVRGDGRFIAECYELLGYPQKAAAVRADEQKRLEKLKEPIDQLRLLCTKARDCRQADPERARGHIKDAELMLLGLPKADQYSHCFELYDYYIEVKDFPKALQLLKSGNEDRWTSYAMSDYQRLAESLVKSQAIESLEEVRNIIRTLQSDDEAQRTVEEVDVETARVKALACAGLPDEAARLFDRYPRFENFFKKEMSVDTLSMRYVIRSFSAVGRSSEAIAFVKKHRALLPDEQAGMIAIAVANAGDFELAESLLDASGVNAFVHQRRALAILAHRAGEFPRRDRLLKQCRDTYRSLPKPDPKKLRDVDGELEIAILDAVFGDYASLQRIAEERNGFQQIDALTCLLVIVIDKQARAQSPDGRTRLDEMLNLDF